MIYRVIKRKNNNIRQQQSICLGFFIRHAQRIAVLALGDHSAVFTGKKIIGRSEAVFYIRSFDRRGLRKRCVYKTLGHEACRETGLHKLIGYGDKKALQGALINIEAAVDKISVCLFDRFKIGFGFDIAGSTGIRLENKLGIVYRKISPWLFALIHRSHRCCQSVSCRLPWFYRRQRFGKHMARRPLSYFNLGNTSTSICPRFKIRSSMEKKRFLQRACVSGLA